MVDDNLRTNCIKEFLASESDDDGTEKRLGKVAGKLNNLNIRGGAEGKEEATVEDKPDQDSDVQNGGDNVDEGRRFAAKAEEHVQARRYAEAVVFFDRAIAANEVDYGYYLQKALALMKMENYDEAEAPLMRASQLKPNDLLIMRTQRKNRERGILDLMNCSVEQAKEFAKKYSSISSGVEAMIENRAKSGPAASSAADSGRSRRDTRGERDDFRGSMKHRSNSMSRSPSCAQKRPDQTSDSESESGREQTRRPPLRSRAYTPGRVSNEQSSRSGRGRNPGDYFRRRSMSRPRTQGYASDTDSVMSSMSRFGRAPGSTYDLNEDDRMKPENIFGHTGLFVGNLYHAVNETTLRREFGQYGEIKDLIMFRGAASILYDEPEAPQMAIFELHGQIIDRLSAGSRPLFMRFKAGYEQRQRRFDRTWDSEECFQWRTTGCDTAVRRCNRIHYPMCRGIDFHPSMVRNNRY